ncbi:MAG TPA: dihydrofolate reductase [Blastocatellia bacterium]|nr:dihydrofolate reductase [Blastocatellia bacterium]
MKVSIIVAMDERRGIGRAGALPWRLSSDLKNFKQLTMGHHIIVGRKTFESIGKPLPGRTTIIVTRNESYRPEGCLIARSVEEAINLARARGEIEAFICGGAEIYARALALADRIYLTLVHAEVAADTFFPEWNRDEWIELESAGHAADEKNQYPFTFKVLVRKDVRD